MPDESAAPKAFLVANVFGMTSADHSDRLRHELVDLVARDGYDAIEFPAEGGLGLRSIQAKRAGLAFQDCDLVVRLDDCSAWRRQRAGQWPSDPEDLAVDFAEREAFENADVRITPNREALDFVTRLGWEMPSEDVVDARSALDGHARPLVTVVVPYFNLGNYLPAALASLAGQSYGNLEVLVIDDGSTDERARAVLEEMRLRYPGFRFLRQTNAGIGATRNRGLFAARGKYFLPMDADNVARPDMIERFVGALERNPDRAVMTCYFLAFEDGDPLTGTAFRYAHRPTGGPHTLASFRNVYGDGNAMFRTEAFRSVGGFEADRGTSFEDWEAFVKMVNAGYRLGVVPEHLFFYRHRPGGFSRVTDTFHNHQRVLRQFVGLDRLPPGERAVLWTAFHGCQRRLEQLTERQRTMPYRAADGLVRFCQTGARWFRACRTRARSLFLRRHTT